MEILSTRGSLVGVAWRGADLGIDLEGVGERLELVREALDLEKGEFAASFDVDPSSYSKIIQGKKPLKAEMAFEISERWGITMDYLYRGRLIGLPEPFATNFRNSRKNSDE